MSAMDAEMAALRPYRFREWERVCGLDPRDAGVALTLLSHARAGFTKAHIARAYGVGVSTQTMIERMWRKRLTERVASGLRQAAFDSLRIKNDALLAEEAGP